MSKLVATSDRKIRYVQSKLYQAVFLTLCQEPYADDGHPEKGRGDVFVVLERALVPVDAHSL